MIFSSLYRFMPLSTMVQNHVGLIPWTQHLGSIPRTKYHGSMPKYHGPNTTDQNHSFQHVHTFPSLKLCVYIYVPSIHRTCVYMLLCHSEPTYTSLWSLILCSWPTALWSIIWVSYHQGQNLYIMPTISHFGLDANNHTKSLSLFDIKGKGQTNIFSSLIYIMLSILPLSTCWYFWLSFPFVHAKMYQSVHAPPEHMQDLQRNNMTLYIHCQWPSHHQRLIHTSISQPSGDTQFLTHPPNQVGIYQMFIHDLKTLHHPSHA